MWKNELAQKKRWQLICHRYENKYTLKLYSINAVQCCLWFSQTISLAAVVAKQQITSGKIKRKQTLFSSVMEVEENIVTMIHERTYRNIEMQATLLSFIVAMITGKTSIPNGRVELLKRWNINFVSDSVENRFQCGVLEKQTLKNQRKHLHENNSNSGCLFWFDCRRISELN